jgi:hypothetical protein
MAFLEPQDHLDLLCGISHGGGPRLLLHSSQVPNVASTMADEIFVARKSIIGPSVAELTSIIAEALDTTPPPEPTLFRDDYDSDYDSDSEHISTNVDWIPAGLGQWEGFNTCVAIGSFNKRGYPGMIDRPGDPWDEETIIPYGCDIEVRRVREGHSNSFGILVKDDPNEEHGELEDFGETHCVGGNIWAHEGCYKYLEAWLDRLSSWPMVRSWTSSLGFSLPGELYEIAISRTQSRRSTSPYSIFMRNIKHHIHFSFLERHTASY